MEEREYGLGDNQEVNKPFRHSELNLTVIPGLSNGFVFNKKRI
jgi:hypothetical protein